MSNKVTVITSIKEADKLMKPFLEDLARQTLFAECSVFLVCCNSSIGHTDEQACRIFAEKYDNVQYYHMINDPGIYGVWNMVVSKADTPYITNANVDDRLHPECIEKHVKLLDQKPEIDLAYCYNICSFYPNETFENTTGRNRYPTAEFSPNRMLRSNLPHNHPVWRRSLHDRFGLFDEEIFSAADWDFWLRCVAGGANFELIKENLGLYYWNPQGISTSKTNMVKKTMVENLVRKKHQKAINDRAY